MATRPVRSNRPGRSTASSGTGEERNGGLAVRTDRLRSRTALASGLHRPHLPVPWPRCSPSGDGSASGSSQDCAWGSSLVSAASRPPRRLRHHRPRPMSHPGRSVASPRSTELPPATNANAVRPVVPWRSTALGHRSTSRTCGRSGCCSVPPQRPCSRTRSYGRRCPPHATAADGGVARHWPLSA